MPEKQIVLWPVWKNQAEKTTLWLKVHCHVNAIVISDLRNIYDINDKEYSSCVTSVICMIKILIQF